MSESKGGGLAELLQEFQDDTGIDSGLAIISRDGLIMRSLSLPSGIDEDIVAANAARILFLGEATGKELNKGELQQVLFQFENGFVALAGAGPYAAVMALITPENKLETGAILFSIGILARRVKKLLSG
ncbi:MAG: roadblock/LC7 domain-containing protein [Candidatus Helarchaeota archaeon]